MKRLVYSLPLFFLLIPYAFLALIVLGVGFAVQPFSLLLMFPIGIVLSLAWWVHRDRSRRGEHGMAAVGAGLVLFAPVFCIIVAFFTHGAAVLSTPDNRAMVNRALSGQPATSWEADTRKFKPAHDEVGYEF